jgi:uncharacterized protein (DUF433 family)
MIRLSQSRQRRRGAALATVNEAAYVAGVSTRAVNQAIDRNEIRTRKIRSEKGPGGRALGVPELVYLRLNALLSSKARKDVYRALAGLDLEAVPPVIEMEGPVRLDIGEAVAAVRTRLEELVRINTLVQVDKNIRGGEPVFRGTRVPVHMIAAFLEQGVPRVEILEDYPALDEESLEVAIRYAELYPRRGRPKQAPWRSQPPTHRFGPEELRG